MLCYEINTSTSLTCYCKYVKFIVHTKNNYSDKEKHKKQDCLMGDRTANSRQAQLEALSVFLLLLLQ